MTRAAGVLLLLALAPCPARAQSPASGSAAEVRAADAAIDRHFAFRSSLWCNLHYLPHQQASIDPERRFRGPRPESRRPAIDTSDLDEAERGAWTAAVAHYRDHLARRDLLFDEGMVKLRDALADTPDDEPPRASYAIPAELATVLAAVGPVYRERMWPAHDRRNRAFLEELRPLLRKVIGTLTGQLSAACGEPWPEEPVRVDLSIEAGWAGAYTTLPAHVVVSSDDPRHGGWLAVEILFHEASHLPTRRIQEGIERECAEQGKDTPRQLWHAVLFFTAGELVKLYAGEGFVPYAHAQGLWQRAPGWEGYLAVLKAWLPHIRGALPFDEALRRLIAQLE